MHFGVCMYIASVHVVGAFTCMFVAYFTVNRLTGSNANSPLTAVELGSTITQNLITNVTTKQHKGHKELIRKLRFCVAQLKLHKTTGKYRCRPTYVFKYRLLNMREYRNTLIARKIFKTHYEQSSKSRTSLSILRCLSRWPMCKV